jgi:tetraacyldisaccharide 4'-kinase
MDGDEAVLLASSLPEARVIVGPDRAASARLAASLGADVAILDDGHQHRGLARHLNLVIWDEEGERARGGTGFFREPLTGLARADALLLVDRGEGAPARPPEAPPHAPSYAMRLVPRIPPGANAGRAVYALTGIAGPEGFERSLGRAGLRVVGATRHADHHVFSAEELADAERRARSLGAESLATTAKDRVRTPALFEHASLETLVFDLDAETPDEEALLQAIIRALDRGSV